MNKVVEVRDSVVAWAVAWVVDSLDSQPVVCSGMVLDTALEAAMDGAEAEAGVMEEAGVVEVGVEDMEEVHLLLTMIRRSSTTTTMITIRQQIRQQMSMTMITMITGMMIMEATMEVETISVAMTLVATILAEEIFS